MNKNSPCIPSKDPLPFSFETLVNADIRDEKREKDRQLLERSRDQLQQSDAGRQALRSLGKFMEGKGLDNTNQKAVLNLLFGFWGGYAGTVLDLVREGSGNGKAHSRVPAGLEGLPQFN